jgi:DNA primase
MKISASNWSSKATGDRVDWQAVRDRVDLAPVATSLMGPAPGRRGERGRRLWWHCPFHEDANPSFCVDPGKPFWRCFGCGEHGDAANLVMRLRNVSFPEAVRILTDGAGIVAAAPARPSQGPKPQKPRVVDHSGPGSDRRSALSVDLATSLVEESARRLWEPSGRQGLAYLRGRGLKDRTIRWARLGWVDKLSLPLKDRGGTWSISGVILPWIDRDRVALVKVRRLGLVKRKYVEVFRDRRILYPTPAAIQPGATVIVAEGEFDCLLLGQELHDLGVAVVTLGGASEQPAPEAIDSLCMASRLFIATDGDDAGDTAASRWPAHARRIRPPAPDNDWSDVHKGGFNRLRYLWPGYLCGFNWAPCRTLPTVPPKPPSPGPFVLRINDPPF